MGFGSRKPKVKCSHRRSSCSGTRPEFKAPLRAVGSEIIVLLELEFWILWSQKSKIRGHNNLGSFMGFSRNTDHISSGVRVLEAMKKHVKDRILEALGLGF